MKAVQMSVCILSFMMQMINLYTFLGDDLQMSSNFDVTCDVHDDCSENILIHY